MCVWRRGLLVFLCAVLTPAATAADWLIAPFAGVALGSRWTFVDLDDVAGERKWMFGGTVTILGEGVLGVEGDFAYVPAFFQSRTPSLVQSGSVATLMGNVVLAMPLSVSRHSLRPYVTGGGGLMRAHKEDVLDVFPVNANMFGVNTGGGVVGFLNERIGLRWDVRYFRRVSGGDEQGAAFGSPRLSFWRVTMHVVIRY